MTPVLDGALPVLLILQLLEIVALGAIALLLASTRRRLRGVVRALEDSRLQLRVLRRTCR